MAESTSKSTVSEHERNTQYLSENEITSIVSHVSIKAEDLISSDSYHEEKILKNLVGNYKPEEIKLLIKAAIQISIIGAGNKNYGMIRDDKDNVIALTKLFDNLHIRYKNEAGANIADDEITSRRLTRLFRFHIQKFILDTNRASYIWIKYADKSNKKYMSICFPGGEHLITTKDEALFLFNTYDILDKTFPSARFKERLRRVFIARGIMQPQDFNELPLLGQYVSVTQFIK